MHTVENPVFFAKISGVFEAFWNKSQREYTILGFKAFLLRIVSKICLSVGGGGGPRRSLFSHPFLHLLFFRLHFQGNRTTPSYVAFSDTGRLIGDAAESQCWMNPSNTIFDVKRLIGRKFTEPTVQADMKYLPFKVRFVFVCLFLSLQSIF